MFKLMNKTVFLIIIALLFSCSEEGNFSLNTNKGIVSEWYLVRYSWTHKGFLITMQPPNIYGQLIFLKKRYTLTVTTEYSIYENGLYTMADSTVEFFPEVMNNITIDPFPENSPSYTGAISGNYLSFTLPVYHHEPDEIVTMVFRRE